VTRSTLPNRGIAAVAHRDQQAAVWQEQEAGSEMLAAALVARVAQDLLNVGKPAAVEPGAGNRGGIGLAGAHGMGEIDGAAGGEVGCKRHVHQAALPDLGDGGQAGKRCGHASVLADEAHPAWPLGHQHPSIGQEGEAPGMFQPGGERLHAHPGLCCHLPFHDRGFGKRRGRRKGEGEQGGMHGGRAHRFLRRGLEWTAYGPGRLALPPLGCYGPGVSVEEGPHAARR
jgi:hypothetical protein